ncbi:MAG: hypothetical protein IJ401_03865 [Oscillospiraceae bacterium]|nr:hypothetical protein [Oscillospiraceae bacterium]
MDNRLYIIEGLPCSGKSTTSAFVAEFLKNKGKVEFVDEGSRNHPADYEFHGYIDFLNLKDFSDDEQKKITAVSEKTKNGYIVPLAEFGGELFDKLIRFKIYDFLDWDKENPVILEKWRSFVDNSKDDTIYVFNCVFLQNPMCETMMRFGFNKDKSYEFIKEISDIIKPLNPAIIYLKNDDISSSIKKASLEREGWLEAVIDYHTNGSYGKRINAQGFEGYISCLEERQKRELSILSRLDIDALVLENSHRCWEKAYRTIKEFIG